MIHILIGVIVGMIIGRFFRLPRDCPRTLRGYNCKGRYCDHSDREYYAAKYDEALNKNQHLGGPFNG